MRLIRCDGCKVTKSLDELGPGDLLGVSIAIGPKDVNACSAECLACIVRERFPNSTPPAAAVRAA